MAGQTDQLRFTQIAASGDRLYGLTSDGLVWYYEQGDAGWKPIPMEAFDIAQARASDELRKLQEGWAAAADKPRKR
jgi:hypothetical protein